MCMCVCVCVPFLPRAHVYWGKPRERDFLKTLRLVSAADACADVQHGDAQDDVDDEDKGVGVGPRARPPPPP